MSRNSKPGAGELRDIQTEGLQAVLFTFEQLGEKSAFLQMEFDGVLSFVAARKLTQTEFDDLVRQAVVQR